MTPAEALLRILDALAFYAPLATLAAVWVMYRAVLHIRKNDLEHVTSKLGSLEDGIKRLDTRVDSLLVTLVGRPPEGP